MSASPNIFLSYNREDQAVAKRFAEGFEAAGLSVWWDVTLRSGEAYDRVTEEALRTAKAVVVLWSPRSVDSRWVRAEASIADENGTLVPAKIASCQLPVMFRLTQTADLCNWSGDKADRVWVTFLTDVRRCIEMSRPNVPSEAVTTVAAMPKLTLPDKPSIAVLPFADMTGGKGQDYFTDGMADEITTALTRFVSLFVIANSSTLAYRRDDRDLPQIARELGVRYLLEGSVRLAGPRVRIAVKLTDAIEMVTLWSERFDGTLEDVFALQDTVANAVAAQIEPTIQAAETRRANAKPTQQLDAYDLYLRALHLSRRLESRAYAEALGLLDKAVVLDPGYALAMALAGYLHYSALVHGWSKDPEESRRRGRELASQALRVGDHDPIVLAHAAVTLCFLGSDAVTARTLLERALYLCPGSAEVWGHSGIIKSQFPDLAAEGLAHFETALRLDPRSPDRAGLLSGMASLLNTLQRYEEAIPLLREALQLRPEHSTAGWMLAYSLGSTGQLPEARSLAKTLDRHAVTAMLDATRDPKQREMRRSVFARVIDSDI
jgi:adenylate cyclase